MSKISIALVAIASLCASAVAGARGVRDAVPFLPGHVSTAVSEVRITFSPDGQRMLWGTIDWRGGGQGGWDIYESVKTPDGWSAPKPVSFNSTANDFDPYFAPDGEGVYFFSNRAGGLGKDDIYFAAFDTTTGRYDVPINLGDKINSAGDEWSPALSNDGQVLLFSSDGRGGEGRHDLFFAARDGNGWAKAEPIPPPVNGPSDDFDATFLPDDSGIIMAIGDVEAGTSKLYMSVITPGGFVKPQLIGPEINCDGGMTLGPTISHETPAILYFASNCRGDGPGRMDIYRAPMPAYDWSRERNVQD
jgi:TolB protein